MSGLQRELLPFPGGASPLVIERDPNGRLVRLSGGGRVYVEAPDPGSVRFGEGLVELETVGLPAGIVRHVRAYGRRWSECSAWDEIGRLTHVDGVDMRYDGEGRIVSCRGAGGDWDYGYAGPSLAVIGTPRRLRQILRGEDGRPLGWREDGVLHPIRYDAAGGRLPQGGPPPSWALDPLGRLIALLDAEGQVARTYLWDGWQCLGAIDGPPGAPIVWLLSLDPTGTPVRRISRERTELFPRDAFGESLLAARDLPGLFGGAIHNGLVHLPLRRLDPLTGSFDAPDPLHGERGDPRRDAGWTGPLPVDRPAAGPYTICRNNPVSLADPTGGFPHQWWLIPSSLTWSLQNTVASILGMWVNLQMSPVGLIVSALAGAKPFDVELISARHHSGFGLRADGWLSRIQKVPWTLQYLINEEGTSFTELEDARLFAPTAAFRPTLYASVLRCVPSSGDPFLLLGQRAVPNGAALTDWSRAGGTAEPSFPGSQMPVFPSGGLHLGTVQRGRKAGAATMTELQSTGVVLTAAIGLFAAVTLPGTGLGIVAQSLFALIDPAGALAIGRVLAVSEASAQTSLRTDASLTGLAAGPWTFDALSVAAGSEPLTPVPGRNLLLDVSGSSLDYTPAVSVVRLSRGGTVLTDAGVVGFDVELTLDEAPPAGLGAGTRVRLAGATGAFQATLTANPLELQIVTGGPVAPGDGLVADPAGKQIGAIVVSVAGATATTPATATLDRPLDPIGGAGAALTWARLAPGGEIGQLAAAATGATLSYVPQTPGAAPGSGFVWLQQGAAQAVRRVTARNHDALVLSEALPDANPAPITVERFRRTPPSLAAATASAVQTFAVSSPPPGGARALQIVAFAGPAITTVTGGAALATGATLNAGKAATDTSKVTAGLRPGEAVALLAGGAGAPIAAQVTNLRLSVTLDQALPLGAGVIEAAPLATDAIAYVADRIDTHILKVRPIVNLGGGGTARIDMPRFAVGELVQASWTGDTSLLRITGVQGTTITCGAEGKAVPTPAPALTVTRLVAADPRTGSARSGIRGQRGAGRVVDLDIWNVDHFALGQLLAIIDGGTTYPATVAAGPHTLIVDLAGVAALSGPHDIVPLSGAAAFVTAFGGTGTVLEVADPPPALIGAASAIVIPWSDGSVSAAGQVHQGTVRIPDDHENADLELDRRQSLVDHELVHTLQSARLGPLLLGAMPLWALELTADAGAAGLPTFGPYGAGTFQDGRLTSPSTELVESGATVQVTQNRQVVTLRLGPAAAEGGVVVADADRQTFSSKGIQPGPVQIRRSSGAEQSDVVDWWSKRLQLGTIGGVMNVVSIAGWSGMASLVMLLVSAIRRARADKVTAKLATDLKTLTIAAGQSLDGLRENAQVALRNGERIAIRAVAAVAGQTVTLAVPSPRMEASEPPVAVDVDLSIYTPGAGSFGLRDYFVGTLADPNAPARLVFQGPDKPELVVNDRVEVRAFSGASMRTLITAVDGDAIEIEQPQLPDVGTQTEFLVGKIAHEDPTAWLDAWVLDELNVGFMRYLHDPWGEIVANHMPGRAATASQVFARTAKYTFGTHSWGIPPLGYFWFDNAFRRASPLGFLVDQGSELSSMEQEASHRSGDTYSPIGSFHGDSEVVGDIGRYWLTVTGGTRAGGFTNQPDRPRDFIAFGAQDAPGAAYARPQTITLPAPAAALPTRFATTDGQGNFTGFQPLAWVPHGPLLERSMGVFVAFTLPPPAPSSYRITCGSTSGLENYDEAINAQDKGKAKLFFDKAPADVAVTAAGVAITEGARFDIVPFQAVRFAVSPNGARVYRVTVARPGDVLDAADLRITARDRAAQSEDVEISRFHHFDAASGRFDSGIGAMHLASDLDIAVRRFTIGTVATLPLVASFDHAATAVASARAGDSLFLLVPVPIVVPAAGAFAGAPPISVVISGAGPAPAGDVASYLGDGAAFRVTIPADQPPEAADMLTLAVTVGRGGLTAALTATVRIEPHFTLDVAGGGAASAGPGAALLLRAGDGTVLARPAAAQPAPIEGVDLNGAEATVHLAATALSGSTVVVTLADATKPDRTARRTITVT